MDKLTIAKGFSIRHVNGVSSSVLDADFFANIINFSDFLSNEWDDY